MKKYFSIILLVVTLVSGLQKAQAHDHSAVHGMLVMGTSKIYLSHLPMFHSPHDYQVLLEVQLSSEAQKIYQASLEKSTETVYTLVPEPFVLPEMIKNPKPFKATLYQGHFERGGTVLVENFDVKISKILYFKKFNPQDAKPDTNNFILFGNNEEQFLAHEIVAAPDFDQVLKVKANSENLENANFKKVVVNGTSNAPLANTIQSLQVHDSDSENNFDIAIQSQLYLELDDLN